MKIILNLVAVALVFAAVLIFAPKILDSADMDGGGSVRKTKTYRHTLAEGVSVSRDGVCGTDLIRCGSCRLEKVRNGPFTFGAMNKLCLDGLWVVIPPEEMRREWSGGGAKAESENEAAEEIADKLGARSAFLSSNGIRKRFSALEINSLEILRLDGSNAVPVASAGYGEAKRDGLHLSGCSVVSDGVTNRVGKAILRVKPALRLEWDGGFEDF